MLHNRRCGGETADIETGRQEVIMQRSFDVGLTLLVVLTAVGEQLQHSVAVNSPAKKSETFSVWFRAEPDLPRKKDMKVEKLNRLIGSDYNEMWMSKTAIVTVHYKFIFIESNRFLNRGQKYG